MVYGYSDEPGPVNYIYRDPLRRKEVKASPRPPPPGRAESTLGASTQTLTPHTAPEEPDYCEYYPHNLTLWPRF